jgi:hypothetical protein
MGDGDYLVTPTDGRYEIGLEPAQGENTSAIGGSPLLVVETVHAGAQPVDPALIHLEGSQPRAAITPTTDEIGEGAHFAATPTPTLIVPTIPRPTVDPAFDTTPPTTFVEALPLVSPPTFTVRWGGRDDGAIDHYLVWVRVNGGDWQPWLETPDTSAAYTGTAGSRYEFAVWAVDTAGNWSLNTELVPQAVTAVQ